MADYFFASAISIVIGFLLGMAYGSRTNVKLLIEVDQNALRWAVEFLRNRSRGAKIANEDPAYYQALSEAADDIEEHATAGGGTNG